MIRSQILQAYRDRILQGKRNKLSLKERLALVEFLIEDLKELTQEDDVRARCEEEIALLEEGYPRRTLANDYIPQYRKAIAEAIEAGILPLNEQTSHSYSYTQYMTGLQMERSEHYALTFLKYDQDTYANLRQSSVERNAQRLDNLQVVPIEAFMRRATALLSRGSSEELAIALCALTGRRHTEIVSRGQLTLGSDHEFVLSFHGQQKKKSPVGSFNILSLIPASEVLPHFTRFRTMPKVASLVGRPHDDPLIQAFHTRVNYRMADAFGDILGVPQGFERLTIHRLRGVYAAIAVHFFCPEMRNEGRFLQQYLGHDLGSAAIQHYQHYRLVNHQGQLIRARGVKLPAYGLPAIQMDDEQDQQNLETAHFSSFLPSTSLDRTWDEQPQEDEDWDEQPQTQEDDHEVMRLTAEVNRLQALLKDTQTTLATVQQERDHAIAQLDTLRTIMGSTQPQHPAVSKQPHQSALGRAIAIFNAIKQWNLSDHQPTWAITASLLEREFHINRKAAQSFMADFAHDIQTHHHHIGVTNPRSHNRHNNPSDLKAFIQHT
ncbi:MAG: hypothetical protein EA367_18120 [Leptolyngbya sp. DLM2.Bin15]|nr:MAG: hypothetical protein EA367_18120 [Leptolyngbya sp. DLM2.Bin15]